MCPRPPGAPGRWPGEDGWLPGWPAFSEAWEPWPDDSAVPTSFPLAGAHSGLTPRDLPLGAEA